MTDETKNFSVDTFTSSIPAFKLLKSKRGKRNKKVRRQKYLARKARKILKKRRKDKRKRKGSRLFLTPISPTFFEIIEAPVNFSFINNTEEVLDYFKKAAKNIADRKQVSFDLQNIENLTPDTIALLIAKVKDRNFTRGLTVNGTSPRKQELKKIFESSGFYDHVRSTYVGGKNQNNLLIHQVTCKKVEPDIAKEVSKLAVKHTFKNEKKFQPIYKIMIECMANTDNHADLKNVGIYDWWIFTYCNPENNVTYFTFLDLGIGIFNSNPVNEFRKSILITIDNMTKTNLTSKDNLKLIPKLFSGEIYISRTKDKKRGQGLPTIKEMSENQCIKNFTIVTNNTKIKLPSLESEILNSKFNGTLLYWELHQQAN
jgi:hypothetical protein